MQASQDPGRRRVPRKESREHFNEVVKTFLDVEHGIA